MAHSVMIKCVVEISQYCSIYDHFILNLSIVNSSVENVLSLLNVP